MISKSTACPKLTEICKWLHLFWFFLIFTFTYTHQLFGETAQSEIVYITNTGRRYHRDNCSSLANSKIAVSIIDASRSYSPCSVCNPPVIDISKIKRDSRELYRVNLAGIKKSDSADINRMLRAEVIGHIDGDTVRVIIPNPPEGLTVLEIIRFLGVDTPETVRPNQAVQHFAIEASDFTRNALLGRTVYLAFDWDLRDRYGRLLTYIYTGSGRCFNSTLIQEGFAYAYLRYPFQFMEEFELLEQGAKRQGKGLWAVPGYR